MRRESLTIEKAGLGKRGDVLLHSRTSPQIGSDFWVYRRGTQTLRGDPVSQKTRNKEEALSYGRSEYGFGSDVTVIPHFAEYVTVEKFSGPL